MKEPWYSNCISMVKIVELCLSFNAIWYDHPSIGSKDNKGTEKNLIVIVSRMNVDICIFSKLKCGDNLHKNSQHTSLEWNVEFTNMTKN